ncbi:MAG: methyltransferase, partial [Alphaproteobacteria bacterium]
MGEPPTVSSPVATDDTLLGGQVRFRQPAKGYRVAIDPVLLAAFVTARTGEAVLDAGCGVGAAALCLLRRVPECRVTGLEIDGELAALARENAELNGMTGAFRVIEGDVAAPPATLKPGTFEHVMMNPPFHEKGRTQESPVAAKARANVESAAGLADWIMLASVMLCPRGIVSLIHRADRLDHVVSALSAHGFCGVTAVPLLPGAGRPAKRVLVRAERGGAAGLTLLPGLVLHDATGQFTKEADRILRDG